VPDTKVVGLGLLLKKANLSGADLSCHQLNGTGNQH